MLSSRTAVILVGAGASTSKVAPSHLASWSLAGALSSSSCGPLHRLTWVFSQDGSWLPQKKRSKKEQGENPSMFSCPTFACHTLSFPPYSVHQKWLTKFNSHSKGRKWASPFESYIKECVDIVLKPPHLVISYIVQNVQIYTRLGIRMCVCVGFPLTFKIYFGNWK